MYTSRTFTALPDRDTAEKIFRDMATDRAHYRSRPVDKPLALYGAGSLGRMAREYLNYIGIPIKCVIDANARQLRQENNASYWQDIPLLTPDEATPEMRRDWLLAHCVVTAPYAPIATQLSGQGWRDIVPFYDIAEAYRHKHPLSNGWFAPPFTATEEENIATALNAWDDDVSRAHHLQFLAWRRLRQEWSFPGAQVDTSNRFFIPEILSRLGSAERFLDAGAHHGQVAVSFIERLHGRFDTIWAIEPDALNRQRLSAAIDRLDEPVRRKIEVLTHVLGETDTECAFASGLGYASQCSPLGAEILPCRTIDSLDLDPTLIKLHLEGMELPALLGAARTLERHHPIVMVTVYHNDDGLWRTPSWLRTHLPGHSLLLRLHSWGGTGAVVYAIPKNGKP